MIRKIFERVFALVCFVLALALLFGASGCQLLEKTPLKTVGVTVEKDPIPFGNLLDPCEAFIKITEMDNASEVAFRNWYFRNLERSSACATKHEKIVELLRKHDIAK